jgi:hypothetical protein
MISQILEIIMTAIEVLLADPEYEELRKHVPKKELQKVSQAGIFVLKIVYTFIAWILPFGCFFYVKSAHSKYSRTIPNYFITNS